MFNLFNRSKIYTKIMAESSAAAEAIVKGSPEYPAINGKVSFYPVDKGVIVVSDIRGLPKGDGKCDLPVLGYHIHEFGKCSGNDQDPFADAGGHFNPNGCEHPFHAGDMPPLFSMNGFAWNAFYTTRFNINDIIGKSVIIHSHSDDFKTQPSGDSMKKIACGVIKRK